MTRSSKVTQETTAEQMPFSAKQDITEARDNMILAQTGVSVKWLRLQTLKISKNP
jgi:hypothetical protein